MRRLRTWTLALAALAVCVPAARADETERMIPEDGAIQLVLLRQKCVRDSLKLTDDQAARIREHNGRQWKRAQEIHKLPRDQRDAQYEVLSRENDQFLDQVLDASKRKRLDEISLQVAGLLLATSPKIATRLNLSEAQIQQLRRHQDEARRQLDKALDLKDQDEREKKIEEMGKNSRRRLDEVLNDQQEAVWKQLLGEKFEGKFGEDS
jgi:Spy/CpxP family protein refolding chaperone